MCILIMYFLSVLQPSSLSRDIETKALIEQSQIYPKHICVICVKQFNTIDLSMADICHLQNV